MDPGGAAAAAADPKDFDQSALDVAQFEQLERDFQEVLTELVGDKSLERFRVEYEKLHRALRKSHDNEKRLIRKCRELNSAIVANTAKVSLALKMSSDDHSTIQSLRKEIERAWKLVESAHEKESRAKETIQHLRLEISNLSKLVEQGAGLAEEESSVQELKRERDALAAEKDQHVNQIVALRSEVAELMEKVRATEAEKSSLESEIQSMRDTIAAKKQESEREQRRKERLENENAERKKEVELKMQEIKAKQAQILSMQDRIAQLEQQVKDQKAQSERLQKEFDLQNQKTMKLQQELDEQMTNTHQLMQTNSQLQAELNLKETECERLRGEQQRLVKMRDALQKRIQDLEAKRKEVEKTRDGLRSEISQQEKKIDALKRQSELEKKHIDDLMRERDLLTKNLQKALSATQRQADLVKINEGTKKTLEATIQNLKSEAQAMYKQIYQLEKEREKYGMEASEATAKYLISLQEVKAKQMRIMDLNKRIAEGEAKLKQQQNLYEAVRSDRNLYSKHLIEAQDEIAEMRRKFKIMNHQIEQLKEEIQAKDQSLVKVHFDHEKVKKERETLKYEVGKLSNQTKEAEETLNEQKAEIAKLDQIIKEADLERQRQKKDYDMVINERDVLGTQLIRRNDELALLYEKIKIQQSTLQNGEIQYRQRMQDIRILKLKIADLKRELHILKASVANIDSLRNEVYHLQRELLQERTKVKALSEELENPMNVHRWRKLEGSDPSTYELIQKVQALQKRLITKTEEAVEKDLLIQEKEKLYVELKNILARQPGPEVAEQLNIYRQNLREKTKQLKAMASELNMFQSHVSEYKYEIERLTRELQEVKKRYYERKRADIQSAGGSQKLLSAPIQPTMQSQPRFTGGGFSLAQ
eukprot:TRINITY_DN13508_c0_g1_i1.p1 TRINITY_DN13508_c0_g1~~TRINITY_DN13508_c0_g1_i1.p1  ORF type:complete len:877 (-),score=280.18 TRINITY_DN13508_c0_g1_i1:69-2699(-)